MEKKQTIETYTVHKDTCYYGNIFVTFPFIFCLINNCYRLYPGYHTKKFFPQQGEDKMAAETYLSTLSTLF